MDWEIELLQGGGCDVRRDRRPVAYDLYDVDEALEYARRQGATEVTIVELDGYRMKRRI